MLNCAKCKIRIRGDKLCCPLCGGRLSGEPEDPCFPAIRPAKLPRFTFLRITAFVVVVLDVLLLIIAYLLGFPYLLNLLILALPLLLLDLMLAIYLHGNLIKMITVQGYIGIGLIFAIDWFTAGYNYGAAFIIPVLFVLLMAGTVLTGELQRLRFRDYVIYLVFDCLCSMLQLIPIVRGVNPFPIPALISIGATVIFAAFMLIFRFRDLQSASSKYLNL